ncbi:MAG TPA: hypothetical protein VGP17_10115 [Solirubrobacteraceae bacterium]|jgi:hypothetical protein|nr:hypothetical protein [Solirubrobacteraceae bacterium]
MRSWLWVILAGVCALVSLVLAGPAVAAEERGPVWRITTVTDPTNVVPGSPKAGVEAAELVVTATNVGGAATTGSVIELTDRLGSSLEASEVVGYDAYKAEQAQDGVGMLAGSALQCAGAPAISCTYSGTVDPGDQLVMTVTLNAKSALGGEQVANDAKVLGGGAQSASSETPILVSESPAGFGPTPGSVLAALSTEQAGAHPNLTTAFTLNTSKLYGAAADTKDVRFDLPPGVAGSTVGWARCSMAKIVEEVEHPGLCPASAMVGIATVTVSEEARFAHVYLVPVYNIAPSPGEPAAFGFDAIILPVRLDTSVLSNEEGEKVGVRVTVPDVPESAQTISTSVTIWGVPAEHSGPGSDLVSTGGSFGGPDPGQASVPLLTNPCQCKVPLEATLSVDSWEHPGEYRSEQTSVGKMTGCDHVPFSSSFLFLPETLSAGAPSGYAFELNVPQSNEPETLGTSSVKDVSLTLPPGVVVNPSAASALKSCTPAQFYGSGERSARPATLASCPSESQVGEVEVESPDLEKPLKGQIFVAESECGGPCTPGDAEDGKLVRLFIQVAGEGEEGVIVKLEGRGEINQTTGQITTVFEDAPQLPFGHLHLTLNGGPKAVLVNPRTCGPVKSSGDLTPWSTEMGVSDSTPTYEFEINQGCFGPQFSPSFKAGMNDAQAGAHGEFTLAFGREDHDEYLGQVSVTLPPGLLGTLTGVEKCGQAQAEVGTCGTGSELGSIEAYAGAGSDPYLVTGGKAFLTEGYGGAPFGLSVVVPAVAGPFTLSGTTGLGTVVVRSQIFVNSHTSQISVISGQIPSMLDGIPLQVRAVKVHLSRPGFMFNPTNCEKQAITGTIAAVEGLSASVSAPFQAVNCATLQFKPTVSVLTHAGHTRRNGAYLHVKVTSAAGQANIKSLRLELPKVMPSRQETLHGACSESQFASNPAGCPAAAYIGTVVAHTPVLPVPLTGPLILVSHGGAGFPDADMVLQGDGVTIIQESETDIVKDITSSDFKAVPDAPLTSVEVTLPPGPHSLLTATANLCTKRVLKRVKKQVHGHAVYRKRYVKEKRDLVLPVLVSGQNGASEKQSIKIVVEGCAKK